MIWYLGTRSLPTLTLTYRHRVLFDRPSNLSKRNSRQSVGRRAGARLPRSVGNDAGSEKGQYELEWKEDAEGHRAQPIPTSQVDAHQEERGQAPAHGLGKVRSHSHRTTVTVPLPAAARSPDWSNRSTTKGHLMKRKPIMAKVVKCADGAGTASLTRTDNKVFCTRNGQTLWEKTFSSNREAKRFMGETSTI